MFALLYTYDNIGKEEEARIAEMWISFIAGKIVEDTLALPIESGAALTAQ